jgi:hypothetical protein
MRATAAVRILLLELGMAALILVLSSELMAEDVGIVDVDVCAPTLFFFTRNVEEEMVSNIPGLIRRCGT